jgi:RNA polymerase sigma-70 factor (ECF subfamily)
VQDCWDDHALYQGLLAQDARALEALIGRYSRELTYFVRMVLAGVGTAQDAEECVADLFMTVWDEIEDFDASRGALGAWLSMRAKYLALDRRRHILRRMGLGGSAAASGGSMRAAHPADIAICLAAGDSEASVDSLIERRERQEELRRVLEELPELDRLLIYLRYFRLASTEEIATRTGLTRRAIDTRLWRTRRHLRVALEAFEEQAHGHIRAL